MGSRGDTDHINEVMNDEVADPARVPTASQAMDELALKPTMGYVGADAFIGNPYSLLGRVVEVRSVDGKCPGSLAEPGVVPEFSIFPIPGVRVDESSKIKKPIKRSSILVDRRLAVSVSFLNFLAAELDAESSFSIMVFDQATGLVDVQDESWEEGVLRWKERNATLFDDPEICYLYVVIGMVQKNILRKKYTKFRAGAKGGAYGVNVDGTLHTSTEDFSLDIRFGLLPAILKRPPSTGVRTLRRSGSLLDNPTSQEVALFSSMNEVRSPASLSDFLV